MSYPASRRLAILRRLRDQHALAWFDDTGVGALSGQLSCRACATEPERRTGQPLGYDALCALYVAEGANTFPVCDRCGRDLGTQHEGGTV